MKHSGPNDSAFPWTQSQELRADGMTMREWYAGQALAGLMANSDLVDLTKSGWAPVKGAEICFAVADAMLQEGRP